MEPSTLRPFWRRHDSLFARLLIGQILLAASLTFILMVVFYVERNQTLAAMLADRWSGALTEASGLAPHAAAPLEVKRSTELPSGARLIAGHLPRMVALRERLAERGLHVADMAIGHDERDLTIWLHIPGAPRGPVWLGISGPPLVEHDGGERVAIATVCVGVLVLLLAWALARWIAKPLEQLSARIRVGESTSPSATHSPPEIAAIGDAYSELLARLAQQDRERALLLAGVSHDLRSPLARIRLAAELMPKASGVDASRSTIVRNVHAMDRLIGSFLDLIRVGELELTESVDLVSVAQHAASEHQNNVCSPVLDLPSVLVLARGNHLLLERMVGNLVDNAFKHGEAPVRLRLLRQGDSAVIEVEDAGPGIDPSQQDTVLDAFARGDAARSVPGLGLGLAIVMQGVRRLGGHFEFDSKPGRHIARIRLFGVLASGAGAV